MFVIVLCGWLQGFVEGVFMLSDVLYCSLFVQVEGLMWLIEDLCVVSFVDSGYLSIEICDIDFVVEVCVVVDVFVYVLQVVGQYLEFDFDLWCMCCDLVWFCQVLFVLLENVCCYVVFGVIWIQMCIENGMCWLCVEDDGFGILVEFVLYVFQVFWCVDEM